MPITPQQTQQAQAVQQAAAQDVADQVRLVAGPGTGKSFSIESRVLFQLQNGADANRIYAISFTRASSLDLRTRIQNACVAAGRADGDRVRVSTLHSLALRALRAANLLHYPAEPLVLDSWEVRHIFDEEFAHVQHLGITRSEEIRRDHEAFWSTGNYNPPNYIPPDPPITAAERTNFDIFHGPRTQTYSCVLPGEIVRQCLQHMVAGNLDPVALLHIEHLIVDEFQDLNPVDLQFVQRLIASGAVAFVAGDDDQSIYSFRYASPAGIQNFTAVYPQAGQHTLQDCFRCTPAITDAANALINANQGPNRIPKQLSSLYSAANPPVPGVLYRWTFNSGAVEAQAIARSCRKLVDAGLPPREILILMSNVGKLLPSLRAAFDAVGLQYEAPRQESFLDSDAGRFVHAICRIVCNIQDYVAHRLILGLRRRVGIATCNAIAELVLANQLNYHDIFHAPLPNNVFTQSRTLGALNAARADIGVISGWARLDTVGQRTAQIEQLLQNSLGLASVQDWQGFAATLPPGMNLEELQNFIWADTDDQKALILNGVLTRQNLPIPAQGLLPEKVRIMTMHGAKGLSSRVVFIPGLEADLIPGAWRRPYPGLVLEAARLLYVSLTRSRAACIVSRATRRLVNGRYQNQAASSFAAQLNGPFLPRQQELSDQEVQAIMQQIANL